MRASPTWRYWLYGLLLGGLAYLGVTRLLPGAKQAAIRRGSASFLVHSVDDALHRYADEHQGGFPPDLDLLYAPRADGSSYFGNKNVPRTDPWDHPLLYEPPTAARARPRVRSLGADGVVGGEGEDADIEIDPERSAR